MKIAIDLDDVIVHTAQHFLDFHNDQYGTNHLIESNLDFDYGKLLGCPTEEAGRRVEEFHARPSYWELSPNEDVQSVLQRLGMQHDLFLVTSRAVNLREKTEGWIGKYFPNLFKGVHFSNHQFFSNQSKSKGEICQDLNVSVIVDDNLHYLEDCKSRSIGGIVFDQPWNRIGGEHFSRVRNWQEAEAALNSL